MVKMNFQNPKETSYSRSLIFLSYPDVKLVCALGFSAIVVKCLHKTVLGITGPHYVTYPPSEVREPRGGNSPSVTFHCPTVLSQRPFTQDEWCQDPHMQ